MDRMPPAEPISPRPRRLALAALALIAAFGVGLWRFWAYRHSGMVSSAALRWDVAHDLGNTQWAWRASVSPSRPQTSVYVQDGAVLAAPVQPTITAVQYIYGSPDRPLCEFIGGKLLERDPAGALLTPATIPAQPARTVGTIAVPPQPARKDIVVESASILYDTSFPRKTDGDALGYRMILVGFEPGSIFKRAFCRSRVIPHIKAFDLDQLDSVEFSREDFLKTLGSVVEVKPARAAAERRADTGS